jgi:hypothetical protein
MESDYRQGCVLDFLRTLPPERKAKILAELGSVGAAYACPNSNCDVFANQRSDGVVDSFGTCAKSPVKAHLTTNSGVIISVGYQH